MRHLYLAGDATSELGVDISRGGWPNRDGGFCAVASRQFERESAAEPHFHALVYERCGNDFLLNVWQQMTQKMQLGLAMCRLTHTPKPDYAENHRLFLTLAVGNDLNAMLEDLNAHLLRGLSTIRAALRKTAAFPN